MGIWRGTVSLNHSSLGGQGSNTWHVRTIDPITDELDDLGAIINQFYTDLNAVCVGTATATFDGVWTEVAVEDPVVETSPTWTVTWTGSALPLPPANCIVVSWLTASPTRRGRGRTFLGPLKSSTLEANGTPEEATRTAVLTAADNLVGASASFNNGAIGVFSRAGAATPWGGTLRDLTSCSVANKFAVLRSRRD